MRPRSDCARSAGRAALGLVAGAVVVAAVVAWLARESPWTELTSDRVAWQRPSRATQLDLLPLGADDVVFLGASLVEHGEWSEWLAGQPVRNRGLAGDTVADVLARLGPVVAAGPRRVFVMVGLNDLFAGTPVAAIETRHRELATRLTGGAPGTRVVFMSLLPVRRDDDAPLNAAVDAVNAGLRRVAVEHGCAWLDLAASFRDEAGRLRAELTLDGVHLTGAGYALWAELLLDSGLL